MIELFDNIILAMRARFFRAFDFFVLHHGLEIQPLIDAMCLDKRIILDSNNGAFGCIRAPFAEPNNDWPVEVNLAVAAADNYLIKYHAPEFLHSDVSQVAAADYWD